MGLIQSAAGISVKRVQDVAFTFWHRGGVKLEFVQNSFDLTWKFAIRLIRKGKKYSKNSMKINSKFVLFDSTPTIGWFQIFSDAGFVWNSFDSKIYDSIDSKGEK